MHMQIFRVKKPSCKFLKMKNWVPFEVQYTNSGLDKYNAYNVYCRELAPGTVSLTGDRALGDDSKHWANSNFFVLCTNVKVYLYNYS